MRLCSFCPSALPAFSGISATLPSALMSPSTLLSASFCLCSIISFAQQPLTSEWQSYLDSLVAYRGVTGVMVHVEAPGQNMSWTGAAGVSEVRSLMPLTGNEAVRIASITKSFVAIAILRLWEEGKLKLNDPITKYISKEHCKLLTEGGYHPEAITIRHLLTHTGGLFDHGSSATYLEKVLANPNHQWTRTEQIKGSMTWGKPVGKPGERFSYSDTGYILLGEVIETLTGKPLGIALRELIDYDDIHMDDTWFEITEPMPSSVEARAHQYLDTTDTYSFHPSLDLYGGGGIVTTLEDLTDLYRGLFEEDIYENEATLDTMLAPVTRLSTEKPYLDYRMGIWSQPVGDFQTWTHSGFWGVQVWYVPELDGAVAVAAIRQEDYRRVTAIVGTIIADLAE